MCLSRDYYQVMLNVAFVIRKEGGGGGSDVGEGPDGLISGDPTGSLLC